MALQTLCAVMPFDQPTDGINMSAAHKAARARIHCGEPTVRTTTGWTRSAAMWARTVDVLAGDGATLWQCAWGGDHHRVLARDPLPPVLLVCHPRLVPVRRVLPVAVQGWVVRARVHQRHFPLKRNVHCVHGAQVRRASKQRRAVAGEVAARWRLAPELSSATLESGRGLAGAHRASCDGPA